MHQLVWLQSASGRQSVMDFTGPQYDICDTLESTGTPFWSSVVSGGRIEPRFGLELRGAPAIFSDAALPVGVLDSQMHTYIADWIAESVLGVLRAGTWR